MLKSASWGLFMLLLPDLRLQFEKDLMRILRLILYRKMDIQMLLNLQLWVISELVFVFEGWLSTLVIFVVSWHNHALQASRTFNERDEHQGPTFEVMCLNYVYAFVIFFLLVKFKVTHADEGFNYDFCITWVLCAYFDMVLFRCIFLIFLYISPPQFCISWLGSMLIGTVSYLMNVA